MKEEKVKCTECARLDKRTGFFCVVTGRAVTPQSERRCRYYLRGDYKEKIGEAVSSEE